MVESIETTRLYLRKFVVEDAQMMFDNWAGDPAVTPYLTWTAHETLEATKTRLEWRIKSYEDEQTLSWAIVEKKSGAVIGSIDIVDENEKLKMKEIGYVLGKAYWGNGYMTEALHSVIDYVFAHTDTNRIEAFHDEENPASGKVMLKAGLLYEGILKQRGFNNRGIVNIASYGLIRSDYLNEQTLASEVFK